MLLALLTSLTLLTHVAPAPCTVTLAPEGGAAAIQQALDRADNPLICLKPGVFRGARFVVAHAATLQRLGAGEVVLDAGGQGRVLTLPVAGVRLALAGVTLTGGRAEQGGAIQMTADAALRLTDCQIHDNTATRRAGGGLWASAGTIVAVRTRWSHNLADTGAAIALVGTAQLRLIASLVTLHPAPSTDGAPIYLAGAAQLDVISATIAYNAGPSIAIAADLQEKPRLLVTDSLLLGAPNAFSVSQRQAENVDVQRSVVSGRIAFVSMDLASKRDAPQLDALGVERAMPALGSPAIDLARCLLADQHLDLLGKKRAKRCTAGALEPSDDVVGHTRWLRENR